MKRIFHAIKKYLIRDPLYFFLYAARDLQLNHRERCIFYSEEEISRLIRERKSIVRLGDGEIANIHYLDITPQHFSKELQHDLRKMIIGYKDDSSYVIGIPIFVNYSNRELDALGEGKRGLWLPLKVTFDMIFNKNAKYLDAHLFYRTGRFEKIILNYILQKKIILVTNEKNIEKTKNLPFSEHIFEYIACAPINAYDKREQLKRDIIDTIAKSSLPKENFVILFSAGSAKTIIPELSAMGYQLLDVGTGYEAYAHNLSLEDRI